jgi:hypothetical protein
VGRSTGGVKVVPYTTSVSNGAAVSARNTQKHLRFSAAIPPRPSPHARNKLATFQL